MQQETLHKSLIRDFYRRAVGQGDITFAAELIADEYIQHSLAVKPGKAGLLEALAYMKQLPKPATTSTPFLRLIAEGDYVVTNMRFEWEGKQKVVIDLFRFRAGQVVEHWDAVQDQPERTPNGNAMMDGPVVSTDPDLTEMNKKRVSDFYQRVFVNQQVEALAEFVAPDLIQHHPDIANGLVGLQTYFHQQAGKCAIEKVHRIIGEGNFVVVQSEGKLDQQSAVFYDVFRLEAGQLVEQWSVRQLSL